MVISFPRRLVAGLALACLFLAPPLAQASAMAPSPSGESSFLGWLSAATRQVYLTLAGTVTRVVGTPDSGSNILPDSGSNITRAPDSGSNVAPDSGSN